MEEAGLLIAQNNIARLLLTLKCIRNELAAESSMIILHHLLNQNIFGYSSHEYTTETSNGDCSLVGIVRQEFCSTFCQIGLHSLINLG